MLPLNIYLDAMAHGKLEDMYSLMSLYLSGSQGSLVFVCICVNICSLSIQKNYCLSLDWKLRPNVLLIMIR